MDRLDIVKDRVLTIVLNNPAAYQAVVSAINDTRDDRVSDGEWEAVANWDVTLEHLAEMNNVEEE